MKIKSCLAISLLIILSTSSNQASATAVAATSWHSPSLSTETVVAPNGAITTHTALTANQLWGLTESKTVEKVNEDIYALRGWGIASSYAIRAPNGWIIIDTGDSTRAAKEMRSMLEQQLGEKINVAAVLLTHWHYSDGTGAWLDQHTEIWGHEYLDRNRNASKGVSIKSGFYLTRAVAQFGVFHPTQGADAFPNLMRFSPEKLLAESSYKAPTHLFQHGQLLDLNIAGEPLQVAPNRTDTSDSVAFYFPRHRLVITNMMVTGAIFNIYTLRGGAFRDPNTFLHDARWVEAKNAEILLDIHGPTLKGQTIVSKNIERSVDQVQLIHDQTLRLIAQGLNPRQAAETLYMPAHLRNGREAYGQVESHVRQIWNGTVGWFDGDVYEINPLSQHEEASRIVTMMGGVDTVLNAAAEAEQTGGLANWRWSLKLTSLLLQLDPGNTEVRKIRAAAARALGQRTSSANARGFYLTEALQNEGQLKVEGIAMTLDTLRALVGTPQHQQLITASLAENLDFIRYLIEPQRAEGKRLIFSLTREGETAIQRVELRNSVLVISEVNQPAERHFNLTAAQLADFILARSLPVNDPIWSELDTILDRSHLMLNTNTASSVEDLQGTQNYPQE
ncbi:alkyl sulfatase dimerization domain-containing protein [Serratia microhaemolytica]|uniref:alkyl sulfatase dimerization domain-containing protein n=1 Tax=Serratia microhaemolytica TaxID=2675110 RepID=UPI000FDD6DDB|nr:alkyl sulfatase dimerization domain-containing protein [Serratia microhaemolytica]